MSYAREIERVFVIGSPRSGNTWTRHLLRDLLGLSEFSAHRPDEIDWDRLPPRAVVQIHWYPLDPFLERLASVEARVVLVHRHPCDVLMSWLNYMDHVHEEGKCGGACGACELVGATPVSEAFRAWVLSERARELLCFGPAWMGRPGVIPLQYESLVADPSTALEELRAGLDVEWRADPASVLEALGIEARKRDRDAWQYHYWQGRPGLGRTLIPAELMRAIAEWIPEAFDRLGYACDPDPDLDATSAELSWMRLQLASTREHLWLEKAKHRETAARLAALARAG
ncbi:MAG: hypothetical protein SFX72_23130 [Isosphaeraceae bacterium]|nr:hypothetical protein [Isosphaeraceae bacterium]